MIKYNFRYRGPFEYDKFVLNILQFSNEVRYLEDAITNGELNLLNEGNTELKALFDRLTTEDGLMNRLLKMSMRLEQKGLTNSQ